MNPITKKDLRKNLISLRQGLGHVQQERSSKQIEKSLITLLQSRGSCTVGLYYPVKGEPDLLSICASPALSECKWSLPLCQTQQDDKWLTFLAYKSNFPLVEGAYGIPVPNNQERVTPDVLVIPCLGFDRSGYRIGYGAGWYDRTLARFSSKPWCIGVAYSNAEVPAGHSEAHDQPMDLIITENEVINPTTTDLL